MSTTEITKHSKIEYRKVQGIVGDQSFSIVSPKILCKNRFLGIGKGDFVKVVLNIKQNTYIYREKLTME